MVTGTGAIIEGRADTMIIAIVIATITGIEIITGIGTTEAGTDTTTEIGIIMISGSE
jgi:hypothetical protein